MTLTEFFLFFAVFLAAFLITFYLILKKLLKPGQNDNQLLLFLQNQLNDLNRVIDTKLSESTKVLQQQFSESSKIIREITHELTKVGEGQKQVVDIAKQLDNLQDILKNPKQRGVVGEYYLKTVLENVLPVNSFQMQYEFKNGDIVDAAIFIKDKIISVDSKFSLENYNRLIATKDDAERKKLEDLLRQDLKNRIDETSKYIKPSENTMEFAFMFIPSEALYYDLLINKVGSITARDLIDYATIDKKVIIVSPTSFLAYLQTVLQGLKAMQIEESAKEIRKRVEELGRHLSSYDVYFKKTGMHLSATVNAYNSASKELGKIDKDVLRITGETVGIEPIKLEKPKDDEE
ncbi:MAG: DNA recombination protein RmuC [Patescibacteria group bacterium]|nr:DNA recombination protein RmuC [Patescibacteria group bacterium]